MSGSKCWLWTKPPWACMAFTLFFKINQRLFSFRILHFSEYFPYLNCQSMIHRNTCSDFVWKLFFFWSFIEWGIKWICLIWWTGVDSFQVELNLQIEFIILNSNSFKLINSNIGQEVEDYPWDEHYCQRNNQYC